MADTTGQQGLFDALQRFFKSVYSSVKDITGIRINGEIDYLFRQMTGLAPIDDKAIRIQQTFYQTIKAQQTGAKAADEKPSKEQIAKDLDIIKRNGVEKYERPSGWKNEIWEMAKGLIVSASKLEAWENRRVFLCKTMKARGFKIK